MFKKLEKGLLFVVMLMLFVGPALAYGEEDTVVFENINYDKTPYMRVYYEGEEVTFDTRPQTINSRVMVPMRKIFETFGLEVRWNQVDQSVTATNNDKNIFLKVGSKTASVNGVEYSLDTPATVLKGNVMIPLRFISESMGYNIVWNSNSNIILLSKSNIAEWRYGGYERVDPYREYEVKYINGQKTDDIRYTGINHKVDFYNFFTDTGKIVQNVPDFHADSLGRGWLKTSPFENKTFWVDERLLKDMVSQMTFYDPAKNINISGQELFSKTNIGNFIKISIDKHYFDINHWRALEDDKSKYSNIENTKDLDGSIIMPEDALFQISVNDSFHISTQTEAWVNFLFGRIDDSYYGIMKKNPKEVYSWSDADWERMKGNIPWLGMDADMLLIQQMAIPDQIAKIKTNYSNIEIWVYEDPYSESIFYIKDKVLLSIL